MSYIHMLCIGVVSVGGNAWGQPATGEVGQPQEGAGLLSAEDMSLLRGILDRGNSGENISIQTPLREGQPGVIKSFFDGETLIDVSDRNNDGLLESSTQTTVKASQWRARMFNPSARIYFDIGDDDPGEEADIFVNGSITASIDVIEVGYWWDMGVVTDGDLEGWGLGIVGSAGIGTPAITVMDDGGDTDTSTAPVAIFNIGLSFEKQVGDPTKDKANGYIGLQVGYAQGFSTDEDFGDSSDGAVYVGVSVDF